MSHRIPNPIVLDPALGTCRPLAHQCPRRDGCATYLVPPAGRSIGDYTVAANNWRPENCAGWRDVTQYRPDPKVRDSVLHETPKGLL